MPLVVTESLLNSAKKREGGLIPVFDLQTIFHPVYFMSLELVYCE